MSYWPEYEASDSSNPKPPMSESLDLDAMEAAARRGNQGSVLDLIERLRRAEAALREIDDGECWCDENLRCDKCTARAGLNRENP